MPTTPQKLDDLRREIDRIDDELHDLLMRRAEVVLKIGQAKAKGRPYFRPAREAQILRRLANRHTGAFPVPALIRMWREMVAATTRMQGAFAVAVCAPENQRSVYWDVARDHYGSTTPVRAVDTPVAALRAVSEGKAGIAVVPFPDEGDGDPWWRYLFEAESKTPRIVARLPFILTVGGDVGKQLGDSLALAPVALEPSGNDRTLLGLELSVDVSRSRLKDVMTACGLAPVTLLTHHLGGGPGSVHMIEVEDFVAEEDPRLAQVGERLGEGVVRILPLGAYATPISLPGPRKTR